MPLLTAALIPERVHFIPIDGVDPKVALRSSGMRRVKSHLAAVADKNSVCGFQSNANVNPSDVNSPENQPSAYRSPEPFRSSTTLRLQIAQWISPSLLLLVGRSC